VTHGERPDQRLLENGVWYALDLLSYHDASLYLDTRLLRQWAKQQLGGKTVLNAFAYTGSLGLAALSGGASRVLQLDRNRRALALARESYALNGFPTPPADFLAVDFFPAVAQLKRSAVLFDCVLLDPPFFSMTASGVVTSSIRASA
jgi:23S rRNA (cytosine1962-C5)-methyltransferase